MSTIHFLAGLLHQLETCNGTLDKIELLQRHEERGPFKEMLWWALNPYKKFGIQQVPFVNGPPVSSLVWADLVTWLKRVSDKEVTGDALKAEFKAILKSVNDEEREVVRRIVLKDLRCGVGATLVNKAIPNLIPEFGIMLAEPLEQKHLKRINRCETVFFQPKKNGDRSAHIINDEPWAASRKGHPQLNYGHITKALEEVCRRVGQRFVFDGEVILNDFWGTRRVKKLGGNQADNAVLHIFDLIPLAQWENGETIRYGKRRTMLKNIWDYVSPEMPIKRVPSYRIVSSQVTWELIEEWRQRFVEEGEEGLIIRLDEPYNFKTRSSLYKRKVMIEDDFMIMEIREGESGKKYEGMAAKILVDLGKGVSCEVGLKGGVETRKELWEHRGLYEGKMCEVHFQEWTKNEKGEPQLQFGVMHKIREDKS